MVSRISPSPGDTKVVKSLKRKRKKTENHLYVPAKRRNSQKSPVADQTALYAARVVSKHFTTFYTQVRERTWPKRASEATRLARLLRSTLKGTGHVETSSSLGTWTHHQSTPMEERTAAWMGTRTTAPRIPSSIRPPIKKEDTSLTYVWLQGGNTWRSTWGRTTIRR